MIFITAHRVVRGEVPKCREKVAGLSLSSLQATYVVPHVCLIQ